MYLNQHYEKSIKINLFNSFELNKLNGKFSFTKLKHNFTNNALSILY
jgi:hypothetical protein